MSASHLMPTECVIDQDDLLTRCMGNRHFAKRILQSFARQFAADLDALESAIDCGDVDQIAVIAHRVKGTSSNVSARGIHRLAAEIAELAKGGDVQLLGSFGLAIRREQQRFLEASQLFEAGFASSFENSTPPRG